MTESQPAVSVIIPVFNDLPGLKTCLESIAGQNYSMEALEVIAVDNGSIPPLVIDSRYPFSLRLVRFTKPGSYAARNAGAECALGDVLAFIDADCWPDKDWLARGTSCLTAHMGESIVGGEVSIVKPEKPAAVSLYQWVTGFGQNSNIRDKAFSATANLFCTREQFITIGPFDERLLSGGDREWCWRAAKRDISVAYAPDAVAYTRPRESLRGAVRQARRVAAGRKALRGLGLTHKGDAAIAKQRSAWQSVTWILSRSELGLSERLRVLWVAIIIRTVSALETIRLATGGRAERE
jgi:glycosyltransferase involved in cell wall biosynthesis